MVKMNLRKEKGITLVALVITIIVLLILAGVTLNIVLNSGIINKSQTATSKYNEQATKEKLTLALTEYKFKQLAGDSQSLESIIQNIGGEVTETTDTEWTIELDGFIFTVDKKTNAITSMELSNVPKLNPPTIGTPTITLAGDSKSATIEVTVTPQNGGTITSVTIAGQTITEANGKYSLVVTTNGDKIITATETKDGRTKTATITAKVENIQEPEPMATIADGNNLTGSSNGTLNGAASNYNNPVIPVGFKTLDTADASWTLSNGIVSDWNKGLVISDAVTDGNEFVWVPVAGSSETNGVTFGTTEFNKGDPANSHVRPEDYVPGITNEDEENMVEKYGGFYIARYEAGIPSSMSNAINNVNSTNRNVPGIPVSKQNQVPWSWIEPTQCKANSETMKTFASTNNHTQSILITAAMWDTTLNWINTLTDGTSVTENCQTWGNYNNAPVTNVTEYSNDGGATWTTQTSTTKPISGSIASDYKWLLKTGHSDYTKRKNIYDLAGNLWEYTNSVDKNYNTYYVLRGCGYGNDGSTTNVAAFRVVLDNTSSHRLPVSEQHYIFNSNKSRRLKAVLMFSYSCFLLI